MSAFYYNPREIVLSISKEEAKSIYDSGIDNNCPGPNRVNELKIWWKPKALYQAFDCFCQDCYWKGKLTAPTGTTYTKDELEPCYIKGLLCNCDGEDRKEYFSLHMLKNFKLAVSLGNTKGHFSLINDAVKIINISFDQCLKEFEGKNIVKRLIIPNKGKRLSLVFEYNKEDLSKYDYISHKFINMKVIYAGEFKKPEAKKPVIKTGKFNWHFENDSHISYENSKKLYLENSKTNNKDEAVYKLPNNPPEYNVDFNLDHQNVLYYNFQLMIMVAKAGIGINFNEYVTFDIHITPEDQVNKVNDFLKSKTDKKKEKEISEIVL